MALVELLGAKVKGKNGDVEVTSLTDNDILGLYFSASWCPPCKMFTPVLADYYSKLRGQGKNFEIVFVSSDREAGKCAEYYSIMPWLLLPFEDRDRKDKLNKKYSIAGIPTLVFVNPKTGETVSLDGRGIVETDKEGERFPWHD